MSHSVLQETLESKTAFIFPGQGSQTVGMGKDLVATSPAAKAIFDRADAHLGFSLSELAFEGPADVLEDTYNAQPALLTHGIALLEALKERAAADGVGIEPIMTAGHSLGEFTALVASGVLDFDEALTLVRERGRLMKAAGTERPGGMAAVLGLSDEQLEEVVAAASSEGIVNIANANCPGQTVISGEVAALLRAMDLAKEAGARRVARLGVSIASHSPLMAEVSQQLGVLIGNIALREPQVPIVGNTTGEVITTVAGIREELAHHVERPVNWTKSVRTMVDAGVTTFIELGAGNVLGGLIKRIDRDVKTVGFRDLFPEQVTA